MHVSEQCNPQKKSKAGYVLYSDIPFDRGEKELSFGIYFNLKRVHNDRKVFRMNGGITGSCRSR